MKKPIFFLNNGFLPADQAKISIADLTIQRGYGVFETLRTYNGKPFRLAEHLKRLFRSAKFIELEIPYPIEFLKKKINETLTQNNYPESTIKIIITGGVSKDTITPHDKPSLCIWVTKIHPYPESCYQKGVPLMTFRHQRFIPECKNLDYSTAVLAQILARRQGASEALYVTPEGDILECTTSNFFLIQKSKIITTKEDVLRGITRGEAIKIAQDLKIPCKERKIKFKDLKRADEAFVTSSVREIMPVVKVDEIKIASGRPGKITLQLLREFRKRTQNF